MTERHDWSFAVDLLIGLRVRMRVARRGVYLLRMLAPVYDIIH